LTVANDSVPTTKPDYAQVHDRTYDIAARFLTAQSVVEVVLQNLDNNGEGMNAELAATLELARDHMSAAHNDLDELSTELAQVQP